MTKYKIGSLIALGLFTLTLVLKLPILVLLVLCGWGIFTAIAVTSLASGIFGSALTRKENSKSVYITFDDGPDPELTPKVLDLLSAKEITATFFLIAEKARAHPELVQRIIAEGHGIGSHDLIHPWWANFRRYEALKSDISKSIEIIESLSKQKVSLYRPPVGLSNPHTHKVCRELNLTITGWNRSARDGGNRSANAIRHLAAVPVTPGDIVLMHDSAPNMYNRNLFLGSLETLISRIKKERFITESLIEK